MLEEKMKKLALLLVFLMVFAVACSKSKKSSPCDGVTCSDHGICDASSGRAVCQCDTCYVPSGTLECVFDEGNPECYDDTDTDPNGNGNDNDNTDPRCGECAEFINGECHTKPGRCCDNSDCKGNEECNTDTFYCEDLRCKGIDCGGHGVCKVGAGYGSGYGSGSDYQTGDIYCECSEDYIPTVANEIPTCIADPAKCTLECSNNSYCNFDGSGNQYCECYPGYVKDENGNCIEQQPEPQCTLDCGEGGNCVKAGDTETCSCQNGYANEGGDSSKPCGVCDLNCGVGQCALKSGAKTCNCPEGYFFDEDDKTCLEDKCTDDACKEWETCERKSGDCIVEYPNCNIDTDCHSDEVCDLAEHKCAEDVCKSVNCGNGGVCTVEGGNAVCNCPHEYYDKDGKCVEITSQHPGWVGVQWPFNIPYYDPTYPENDPYMIYGRIYLEGITGCPLTSHPQQSSWKAQLGYKMGTGSAEYPIKASTWKWVDANFNNGYDCADGNQNHEYMIPFPQNEEAGDYIYIFRFSLDGGTTWWYGDKGKGPTNDDTPGPRFITSETNYPGKATIEAQLTTCTLESHSKTANSYTFTLACPPVDFTKSTITLNGKPVAATDYSYDSTTHKFTISKTDLEPNKYSWLFRLVDTDGNKIEPFFVPFWIGEGVDYAGFGWRDAFVYQIMTDRFLNGDTSNDVGNLPSISRDLEQWKGGDFAGIIKKLKDGYFTDMGVNAIWISTPMLNPHHTSQGGTSSSQDSVYFTSYHAYHPVATGYSFDNSFGYDDNEGVDPAFGTVDELRELVDEAHKRGIRVIPDFVVNHVHSDAKLYQLHKNDGWFYPETRIIKDEHGEHEVQNLCANLGWADSVIKDCWFTHYMPDFNYNNAEARKTVIAHAIWLIQNFNLDGFRADALKHIDDIFVIELRKAIKEKIETTVDVDKHDSPDTAEIFYTVGESLGDEWPRYHTRANMVQGQVNEQFYNASYNYILTNKSYNSIAYEVNNDWDRAYLTERNTSKPAGGKGGFPGAVMGNFFGNHDKPQRSFTICNKNYTLFKHAQTFLLTSPINIPMLYQGDDIGMEGWQDSGFDGGLRPVMLFDSQLSNEQKDALKHIQRLGKFRKEHPALRYGKRDTCGSTDDVWVYKLKCTESDNERCKNGDTVIVGINKGGSPYTATCSGVSGSFTSYDGGTVNISNGSVTVPANGSLVIGN